MIQERMYRGRKESLLYLAVKRPDDSILSKKGYRTWKKAFMGMEHHGAFLRARKIFRHAEGKGTYPFLSSKKDLRKAIKEVR